MKTSINEKITMVFEFVIPNKNADLLSTDKNSYCVARVFETAEIPEKLGGNCDFSLLSIIIYLNVSNI